MGLETQQKAKILGAIEALVKSLHYGGQVVTVESVQQTIAGDASFPTTDNMERIPDAWIVPFILRRPTRQEINADLLEDLRRELTEAMHLTECDHDHFEATLRSILLDLEILGMKYNSILKAFHPTAETDQ